MGIEPADLQRAQLKAAAGQVRFAVANSPFYKGLLGASFDVGLPESVHEFGGAIPSITKDKIVALQQADPPYGGMLAIDERTIERYYVYPTGQVLAWSHRDQATHLDQYAGGLHTAGIRDDDRVDITFQYSWVAAGTIWDAAVRHLGAAVVPGGAGDSPRHATSLRLLRATGLIGFGSFLERIAESAVELGIDPARDLSVCKLIIVGEWHALEAKDKLSAIFGGATVREAYGTGETGLVAAECPSDRAAMHVHPDFLIEVRDPETGDLVEKGMGGELYITPLRLEAQPLLRYRTGDIVEFARWEQCACGRSTPRIGRVVGRMGQYLRVKGMFLNRGMVASVLAQVDSRLGTFHLTVDRPQGQDRLHLRVGRVPGVDSDLEERISRAMKQRASMTVEVTVGPIESIPAGDSWFTDERGL
jgi:phenylacetate-CoA ligase